MPENEGGSPRASDDERSAEECRLDVKQELSELLFSELTATDGPEDQADRCKLLSFDPGRNDRLTRDQKNADIFTSQKWAVLKAWQVFGKIYANMDRFEELRLSEDETRDFSHDRFGVTIVGSSVSGLTFHATLRHLFDCSKLTHNFDDLFEVRYIDTHRRPLQRLLQARDRRIVPRFEFERILRLKPGEDEPSADNVDVEIDDDFAFIPRLSDDLFDAWSKPGEVIDHCEAKKVLEELDAFETTPRFVPEPLCWEAGSVRDVAQQLLDGFNKITDDFAFQPLPGQQQGQSSTGGPVYINHELITDKPGDTSQTARLGILVFPERKKTENAEGKNYRIKTDFVVLATGQGVDISPDRQHSTDKKPDLHYLRNSQASFWNAPKMELDVVESEGKQVLVLGNGDSAAGAIYSTLFRDPEACSHRFLCHVLEHSAYHEWFEKVREAVEAEKTQGTITERWNKALTSETVLEELFNVPENKDVLDSLLRSPVQVSIAVRAKGKHRALREGDPAPPFMKYLQKARDREGLRALRQRLLNEAWPENRIILALLYSQLEVYQFSTDIERELVKPYYEEELESRKKTLEFAVPLHTVDEWLLAGEDKKETQIPLYFKYVLDCRGRNFFSVTGNMIPERCVDKKKEKAEALVEDTNPRSR